MINSHLKNGFFHIMILIVALLVLSLTLALQDGFGWFGIIVKYDFIITPVMMVFLTFLILNYGKNLSEGLTILIVLFFCTFVLMGMWHSGFSDGSRIAGFFPFSDAYGYYNDALGWLRGERFSHFSSRRPIYASFLSTLFGFTSQNLQISVLVSTALNALCIAFAAIAVKRTHGSFSASIFLVLLFLFYRRFIGTTLTENLGFSLACLGFAAMWNGIASKRNVSFLIGLSTLSVALNVRAGAFFVLPTIFLWYMWRWWYAVGFPLWKSAVLGIMAVVFGFILHYFILYNIGIPASGFSNFSNTLYGLVSGGDWTQIYHDHPEIKMLSEPEFSQAVYQLALDRIKESPISLVHGSLRAWMDFFFGRSGLFSFIKIFYPISAPNIQSLFSTHPFIALNLMVLHGLYLCVNLLALVTLYRIITNFLDPYYSFALLAMIGITASVPFVPPWDANAMRAYAATVPIMAIIPILGGHFLLQRFAPSLHHLLNGSDVNNEPRNSTPILYICGFLCIILLIGPFLVKGTHPKILDPITSSEKKTLEINIVPGSFVYIGDTRNPLDFTIPTVSLDNFHAYLIYFGNQYPEYASDLRLIDHQCFVFYAWNTENNLTHFLIAEPEMIIGKRGRFAVEYEKMETKSLDLFRALRLTPLLHSNQDD